MRRNTSVALGDYFESFVENSISEGRYKNASEVIRAGLRLLEEEENKIKAVKMQFRKESTAESRRVLTRKYTSTL